MKQARKQKKRQRGLFYRLFAFVAHANTNHLLVLACVMLFAVFEMQFFHYMGSSSLTFSQSSAAENETLNLKMSVLWPAEGSTWTIATKEAITWSDENVASGTVYAVDERNVAYEITTYTASSAGNHFYAWNVGDHSGGVLPVGRYRIVVKNELGDRGVSGWVIVQ